MDTNRIDRSYVPPPQPDDDDPSRSTLSTPARTAPLRDASQLPDLPDLYGEQLARAAKLATTSTPSSPRPIVAAAVDASLILDGRDTAVMRGLDAFREAATPTYHVPGEGDFKVPTAFRMPGCGNERIVNGHERGDRAPVAQKLGIDPDLLHFGRVSPQQAHRLTQALIDAGKLPAESSTVHSVAERVRSMQFDYGIGLDCAGYAQQAFLAARGVTRAQAGFAPRPDAESLSALKAPFTRVSPESARPGDIVVLDPPPPARDERPPVGHRAIVYDCRPLSAAEVTSLRARSSGASLAGGHVSMVTLDGSWGAGGNPSRGGVDRRSFFYDADSQTWTPASEGDVQFSSMAYDSDHLRGIYRYPVKP